MAAESQPARWSVEDYLEMERTSPVKHEYIYGRVYARAGGTGGHSRISVRLESIDGAFPVSDLYL